MPNLSALADDGIFQPLASTVPAMTFPAWSTFLTGVNPGRHGIFDFTERVPGQLRLRFLNATRRRYPTFLRLVSDQGLKVGSVGLPTTYPPEPLTGFQISGFDTPLPSKAGTSFVYPRELGDVINRQFGGYFFGNFNESRISSHWHERVLRKLLEGIKRKTELVHFLLGKSELDVLLLHVGETDTVGHHFWSFYDLRSPRFIPSNNPDLPDAILKVYQAADQQVGDILKLTRPQTTLVVSDHGMGGTSDRVIYLNRFLADNGFLTFAPSESPILWLGRMKTWGLKWIPYQWQQQMFKIAGGRIAARIESAQRFSGIDWSRTSAYSEELNYFPAIRLNLANREPMGMVSQNEADRVLEQVSDALLSWIDPMSGSPVVRAVHRREKVYRGPEIVHAPDLILELNQPDGYSYALGRSISSQGNSPRRRLSRREYLGYKGGTMNGSHLEFGTMILQSEYPFADLPDDPTLLDMAPLILRSLDLDIPAWMEGREGLSRKTTHMEDSLSMSEEQPYSPQEERILEDRLVKLGYLD